MSETQAAWALILGTFPPTYVWQRRTLAIVVLLGRISNHRIRGQMLRGRTD
jgi:hypothetical protein